MTRHGTSPTFGRALRVLVLELIGLVVMAALALTFIATLSNTLLGTDINVVEYVLSAVRR